MSEPTVLRDAEIPIRSTSRYTLLLQSWVNDVKGWNYPAEDTRLTL